MTKKRGIILIIGYFICSFSIFISEAQNYSTVENLMYPFRPAEFMFTTVSITDSTAYKVYNEYCLLCHNADSETSGVYDGSNKQRGNIYSNDTTLWGKLPRGITFSIKDKGGRGGTARNRWNKAVYYNSTGHGMDSTLSIGHDSAGDIAPLASLGAYGMACARENEFSCHNQHGNKTNISALNYNVKHPNDNFTTGVFNYNTPHIYDSTLDADDEAKNSDRWCGAACHKIGKRGERDWTHTFNYVRINESTGILDSSYGNPLSRDIDIYDVFSSANDAGWTEPVLNNIVDRDQDDIWSSTSHSSYNKVPGDGNTWPDLSPYGYDTNYKLYLPPKSDGQSNRFVCFTCHDPHGTENRGMIRDRFDSTSSQLCLRCHIY